MNETPLHNAPLEQQLKEAAENLEMQPSPAVWEAIENHLPTKKRKIYPYWWAAAAALLLLAGLGLYFSNSFQVSHVVNNSTAVSTLPTKPDTPTTSVQSSQSGQVESMSHQNSNSLSATRKALKKEDAIAASSSSTKAFSKVGYSKAEKNPKHSNRFQPTIPFSNTQFASQNLRPLSGKFAVRDIHKGIPKKATLAYSKEIITLLLNPTAANKAGLSKKDKSQVEGQKLTAGLFFTPGISYRNLQTPGTSVAAMPSSPNYSLVMTNNTTSNNARIATGYNNPKQSKSWGWGTGIRLALHLSKGWLVQSGLSLRETNYKVTAFRDEPAYVTMSGNAIPLNAPPDAAQANSRYALYTTRINGGNEETTLNNRYLSTELPLLIGKRFGNEERMSFTIMAGAGITYLLHAHSIMYAPKSSRYFTNKDYLSPFNGSLILETNLNVPVSHKLQMSVGPVVQYQLFSSYKDYTPVKEFPYLIGIKTGLHLK